MLDIKSDNQYNSNYRILFYYYVKAVVFMAEKVTKIKLTLEGKKKYEAELNELKTVKRKEIAENLQSARAQGDLSENSE